MATSFLPCLTTTALRSGHFICARERSHYVLSTLFGFKIDTQSLFPYPMLTEKGVLITIKQVTKFYYCQNR